MAKNHMDENLKIQSADSAVSSKNVSPTTVTYIAVCNDLKEQKRYGEYNSGSDEKNRYFERNANKSPSFGIKRLVSLGLVLTFAVFATVLGFAATGYFATDAFGGAETSGDNSQLHGGSSSAAESASSELSESDTMEKLTDDSEQYSIMSDIAFQEISTILGASISNITDSCSKIYRVPSGVIINGITDQSAADVCGLIEGDIIIACGSSNVTDVESLYTSLVNSAKAERDLICDENSGEYPIEYYIYGVPVKMSLCVFRNGKTIILDGAFNVSPIG